MTDRRVAVVLASIGSDPAIDASVAGFLREVDGRGEVVVVDATGRGVAARAPGLRVLRRPSRRLVPELWRDGLRSVDADLVAFSTTQMVPRAGWLDAMLAATGGADGVGGSIEPGDSLGCIDRAIFLLRYLAYGSPLPARPSGENALYRLGPLLDVEESWDDGFWEAEVHRALESRGGGWAMAPDATVTYRGSTRLAAIARHRSAHARRFGALRSAGWSSLRRVVRSATMPAVPAWMLARALRGGRRRGLTDAPWLTCLPAFVMLAGLWSWGETVGAWRGPGPIEPNRAGALTDGLTD